MSYTYVLAALGLYLYNRIRRRPPIEKPPAEEPPPTGGSAKTATD
jgi:hypothetical protein